MTDKVNSLATNNCQTNYYSSFFFFFFSSRRRHTRYWRDWSSDVCSSDLGLWALLLAVLSEEQLLSWGWRLPFLFSFVLMLFAIWIRTHLKESPVFEGRADVTEEGVALSREELEAAAAAAKEASVLEAALKQRKGRAFFIALGLRFGQAGNSGLIQTFLVGYLATTLLLDRSIATNAILMSSVVGFATVPLVGLLGDRFGRRPIYMRSEEHTSELQSRQYLVCRLLLEKQKN